MEIFIHRENGDFGPYSIEDLQHYLETGELLPEDYAWYEGATDWMPLEEIPGVMPSSHRPAKKPVRNTTGLPAWIPPRRTDDPDSPSTTSFASPPARPLGIKTLSPLGGTPVPAKAPAAPKTPARPTAPAARSIPIAHPPSPVVADEDLPEPLPAPGPGLRSVGRRNIIFGALWLVGGLAVTLYSYTTTFGHTHGGLYLLSWAAIGGGLIQLVRGVNQTKKK